LYYYVATEEFWLSWIFEVKEKLGNVTKPCDEVPLEFRIKQLYHASLTLCPTADLWVSYLKFLKHRSLSSTNLGIRSQIIHASYIRRMCECAVRDFGLHGTEGPKIWSVYRHFEQLILQKILELANCGESPNTQDRKDVQTVAPNSLAERDPLKMAKQQTERVRSLFCRQMQLPLSGLQDLWDEYRLHSLYISPCTH
jgi:squamous cell carcinoma antigen recognized by T-cells 3